ncbi:MAG TPA: hypothetical protein VLG76_07060, partial [Rhabdochlamydiaceae bacterium]|nr:hypothetical protein [Rhabdochlamydiaceae bacterium]
MTTISHATQFIIANNLNIASRDEEYHPEYTEFMRRTSPTERQEIERKMAALRDGEHLVNELVKALNKKWGIEDPIIAHPDMPYIALLAFKQKKISRFQIGTLLH